MSKTSRKLSVLIIPLMLVAMLLPMLGQQPSSVGTASTPAASSSTKVSASQREQALANFRNSGLHFEANVGQTDPQVRYLARGGGYTVFLTDKEAVMAFTAGASNGTVLRFALSGANSATQLVAQNPLKVRSNYFIGNNPANWHTDVPNYGAVVYQNAYPGIDLAYYGNGKQLEYDFIVAPGATPAAIHMNVAGANKVEVQAGTLVLHTALGDIRQPAPHIYQDGPKGREQVAGGYVLAADGTVSFAVSAYDASRALVIDPYIAYSSYLGGSSTDYGAAVAVDSNGNAYITGYTGSVDFPTVNAINPGKVGGVYDAFVTKVPASPITGSNWVYSTYLGGGNEERANNIAVDVQGNAYIGGFTNSADFPIVQPVQPALSGSYDGFVVKINAAGNALSYSTYLGGGGDDRVSGVAVDSSGNAYVVGQTISGNFPTQNAPQGSTGGGFDAFVAKLPAVPLAGTHPL